METIISAVFVCGLLLGAVAYSAVTNLVQIQNVGTIRSIGVEVYADKALTQKLNEITWGTLDPGETRSANAWIKNTGNDAQKLHSHPAPIPQYCPAHVYNLSLLGC